jgi:hypothetical protein
MPPRCAVGFRRANWRETKLEAQGRCGVERVLGDVSRAVVGQPFDGMRRLADPEATLDASAHQRAHHLAGDAGGRGQPGQDLAIAGIDSKHNCGDVMDLVDVHGHAAYAAVTGASGLQFQRSSSSN